MNINEVAVSSIVIGFAAEREIGCTYLDAGTPVFSDPGKELVRHAIQAGIRIVPIPGASSLMLHLLHRICHRSFRFFTASFSKSGNGVL